MKSRFVKKCKYPFTIYRFHPVNLMPLYLGAPCSDFHLFCWKMKRKTSSSRCTKNYQYLITELGDTGSIRFATSLRDRLIYPGDIKISEYHFTIYRFHPVNWMPLYLGAPCSDFHLFCWKMKRKSSSSRCNKNHQNLITEIGDRG